MNCHYYGCAASPGFDLLWAKRAPGLPKALSTCLLVILSAFLFFSGSTRTQFTKHHSAEAD
jgi:hypothetical protein